MVIEIFFVMVRKSDLVTGLKIFDFEYKLTAYADDSSFFVSDLASGQQILNIFKTFSKFSGLTLNEEKCEVGALGKLGGAQVTLGNLKCINL